MNYGTLWYVAFFGIAAAARVYKSTTNDSKVPVVVLPAIVASGNPSACLNACDELIYSCSQVSLHSMY